MQSGDDSHLPVSTVSLTNSGVVSKQDLAKQLLNTDGASEGGIIAQLTSNPFFTAVSRGTSTLSFSTERHRGLDSLAWEQLLHLLAEALDRAQHCYVVGFWSTLRLTYRMTPINGSYIG